MKGTLCLWCVSGFVFFAFWFVYVGYVFGISWWCWWFYCFWLRETAVVEEGDLSDSSLFKFVSLRENAFPFSFLVDFVFVLSVFWDAHAFCSSFCLPFWDLFVFSWLVLVSFPFPSLIFWCWAWVFLFLLLICIIGRLVVFEHWQIHDVDGFVWASIGAMLNWESARDGSMLLQKDLMIHKPLMKKFIGSRPCPQAECWTGVQILVLKWDKLMLTSLLFCSWFPVFLDQQAAYRAKKKLQLLSFPLHEREGKQK